MSIELDYPTNLIHKFGDLFSSNLPLGHGVNIMGDMSGGVARLVALKYPEVYQAYQEVCTFNCFHTGEMFAVKADDGRWIFNLASQDIPGPFADYVWLQKSLVQAAIFCQDENLPGFAIPRIGAGIGGLEWENVLFEIENVAYTFPDVLIEVWSL